MAFDNVFAGPPTTGAPGTIKSPSLGVDVTNNNLYVSSGRGWQEVSASGGGITQLTGDILAGPGSGSEAATLPVVNSNVGAFALATVTANAKGQVTAVAAGTLPVGSSSTAGIVKVDGTTITATAGVISAVGGGGGGFTQIAQQVVAVAVNTLTLSAIPATFTNLRLVFSGASSSASNITELNVRFNGDTGNNYDWANLFGGQISPTAGTGAGVAFITAAYLNGAGDTTPSQADIEIAGYAGTTFQKTLVANSKFDNGSTLISSMLASGNWHNTAAINAIQLLTQDGSNFDVGTIVTLYGY